MVILTKTDLFHSLFDAFRQHTDLVYFAGGDNPYQFSFKNKFVTVFIGNIHSARRPNPDEHRIQCPGDLPEKLRNRRRTGDAVLVLGFSADVHTFSAWDPDRFLARDSVQRFSLYTRLSRMQEAAAQGLSTHIDTDGQSVIMFHPDLIGLYVENPTAFHRDPDRALQRVRDDYKQFPARPTEVNRRRIPVTSTAYPRSPLFRQEVLEAYSHRCAMCGIQLGLVDAAHIVPHAHPQGHDVVSNGLALCTLHHRSFDTGLLYVREDYSIQLNSSRVEHLQKMGRADGLEMYEQQLGSELILPDNGEWLPAPPNLVLGNELRGIDLDKNKERTEGRQ